MSNGSWDSSVVLKQITTTRIVAFHWPSITHISCIANVHPVVRSIVLRIPLLCTHVLQRCWAREGSQFREPRVFRFSNLINPDRTCPRISACCPSNAQIIFVLHRSLCRFCRFACSKTFSWCSAVDRNSAGWRQSYQGTSKTLISKKQLLLRFYGLLLLFSRLLFYQVYTTDRCHFIRTISWRCIVAYQPLDNYSSPSNRSLNKEMKILAT